MGAGGEAERRWSTRSRHTTTEAPAESHHMKTRSRRGVGTLGRRSRQTSYDKLHELADWKMIGLHDKYADATMSRPMTRGWLHIGLAAISTFLVATSRGREFLGLRHSIPLKTFFIVTFVAPYWASTLLHFIPWRRRSAHDVALVLDFLGISAGFAGQTVAWVGEDWWNARLDDVKENRLMIIICRWAARLSVLATIALAYILTVAVARRHRTPVMVHRRVLRFIITGFNMIMLGVVECSLIKDWRVNLVTQLLGKLFVPLYFGFCVRGVDANAGNFQLLPVVPKIWEAHENWHVGIFLLHLTQFYAISMQVHGLGEGVWKDWA